MSSHTPRPWAVVDGPGGTSQVTAGREHIATITDFHGVITPTGTKHVRVGPANARLIAAAPDLLAALRELLALGQQESIEDGELEAAQKAARAAIAKARGGA